MRTALFLCVITAFAFTCPSAWADLCVRDQFQESSSETYGTGGPTPMAQTFTVGLEGTLCHVQIGNETGQYWGNEVFLPARPVVEIWSTTGDDGQPGSIIRNASVPLLAPVPLDGWTPLIDFTSFDIQVRPGQMYAIVVYAEDNTGAVSVGATASDSYYDYDPDQTGKGPGDLWSWGIWDDPETYEWGLLSDTGISDMQFRTYVVPVPLPAGVWLGICAVSVAGWHLKRRTA